MANLLAILRGSAADWIAGVLASVDLWEVEKSPTMAMQIFLSHAHDDRKIADALRVLLVALFGSQVAIQYSSDRSSHGGIQAGERWRDWIDQRIEAATMTVVLLTPISCASQWVLWEAGAAHAAATIRRDRHRAVPLTFGLPTDTVPGPLAGEQFVKGDTPDDILRLLQAVNAALGAASGLSDGYLGETAFELTTKSLVPIFLETIKGAVSQPSAGLLDIPSTVPVATLAGLWVTAYDFVSGGGTKYHADIATIERVDGRRLRASNRSLPAVTQGHVRSFRNEIQAEIVGRHVIGQWRNFSDARYFGGVHLAILTEEMIMEGYYTALASDDQVQQGRWRWVRLAPTEVDLEKMTLKDPATLHGIVKAHTREDGPIALGKVIQGAP